jgi:lipopolysaccharide/colanic/teichoic acid biosynthesis glycosyltransferase
MPAMLIIAFVIRTAERIPPLYGQTRVGYLGRTFTLWKFQSMRPGADNEGPFASRLENNGLRVTRVGQFLRNWRLDELPQLWNVLRGDMSLVGPRPEWIREVEILETAVPTYHLRHLVPPGLTGWAQVYFRATNDIQGSIEKHHYDLYYLKNFSLALDFSIMLKTFKRVFLRDARVSTPSVPYPAATNSGTAVRIDITSIVGRG